MSNPEEEIGQDHFNTSIRENMLPKQQEKLKATNHTSNCDHHIELTTISGRTTKSCNPPECEETFNQDEQDSIVQLPKNR